MVHFKNCLELIINYIFSSEYRVFLILRKKTQTLPSPPKKNLQKNSYSFCVTIYVYLHVYFGYLNCNKYWLLFISYIVSCKEIYFLYINENTHVAFFWCIVISELVHLEIKHAFFFFYFITEKTVFVWSTNTESRSSDSSTTKSTLYCQSTTWTRYI